MPSNALRHALGQKCTGNFELLRGFIPFQGIVPPYPLKAFSYSTTQTYDSLKFFALWEV